jgi:hypothetical protein
MNEVKKMTLEDYLAEKGVLGTFSDFLIDKLRLPHGQTLRQEKKMLKEADKAREEYFSRREAAIKEYKEKVKARKIVPPSDLELRIERAKGNPDLESTQAARRRLAKQGINWEDC